MTPADPVRILLLNPNTNADVTKDVEAKITETLTLCLRSERSKSTSPQQVEASASSFFLYPDTASFGRPYISDEQSYAVAGHAVLEKSLPYLRCRNEKNKSRNNPSSIPQVDVILLCCFGDPGIIAVREASQEASTVNSEKSLVAVEPVPVIGLAEASILYALEKTKRKAAQGEVCFRSHANIAIVTGGSKWKSMLDRLISSLGYSNIICSVRTIELTGDQIRSRPHESARALARECQLELRDHPSVDTIILGGAGLCGLKSCVTSLLLRDFGIHEQITLIDSVEAGALVAMKLGSEFRKKQNVARERISIGISRAASKL